MSETPATLERSQQAIVGAYTAIALAYCAATTWLFFTAGAQPAVAWIHLVSFAVIAVNYGVLRRTRRFDVATHIILAVGTLVVSSLYITGGWQETGYLWTFAYLPYAIFLASPAVARFWVGVLVGVDALLVVLDATRAFGAVDWLDSPYSGIQQGVFATSLAIFLLCMFLFQREVLGSERTAERRAEESERSHRLLDEAQRLSRIGSWDWDLASDRVVWSAEMYRLLQVSPVDFVPSLDAYLEFVEPKHRPRLAATVERARTDGGGFEMEHRVRRADGALRWIQAQGTVEADAAGHPVRMQGIAQDITERREGDERKLEIQALQQMNRFKTEFMNAAAHELSTPLTPIRLELHVLRSGRVAPEDVLRRIQLIDRNMQRLERLVQDLLDGARLESGHPGLDVRELDLAALVREAVEAHQPTAQARSITLQVDAAEAARAVADAGRISQVLDNFLSNAIKYTPEGGRVQVRLRPQSDGVQVEVEDDGRGFDSAMASRLFHPFSRIHSEQVNGPPGTGLGLYICRGLVEAHGGVVGAESRGPGQGSRFWFTLPTR